MFINDRVIFLQLQKTACTHIAAELERRLGGRIVGKHQPFAGETGGRMVLGSIRDPWDWYVSLWAYGCSGEGRVRQELAASRLRRARRLVRRPSEWPGLGRSLAAVARSDPAFWRRVYRSPDDPGAFREWLARLMTPEAKAAAFEDRRPLPLLGFAGLYTARFLHVFSPHDLWQELGSGLATPADLAAHGRDRLLVDRYIRMETLEEDLAAALRLLGCPVEAGELRGQRTNASRRRAAEHYHDARTVELVADQDRLIAGLFGYVPPGG